MQSVTVYAGGPSQLGNLPAYTTTFGYDNVNRLNSATDSGGWSRTFGYDRWGNMWVSANNGVPLAGNTPQSNIFSSSTNQMSGQSYDAGGNQTSLNGNAAAYDAENHLLSLTEQPAFGGATESLKYDGAGQRVQKVNPSGTTTYVYDAFGQLATQYTTAAYSSPCTTCYLTYDHLGNIRLVTDQNANVVSRHDYLPFGEEIPGGYAGRNSQFGATDYVNPRFTGQMRDSETGLDYFNARYFGAALGRFTSPDPMNAGADMSDPQTWNGYGYVRNSPLSLTDPSGQCFWCWFAGVGLLQC